MVKKTNQNKESMAAVWTSDKLNKWPRLFMGLAHHRTTKGESMTFADKPWLEQMYKDNNPNIIGMKCSQVHFTEQALCAMYTFAQKGLRGMYILPSKEHRRTFVSDRINAMRNHSELYRNSIKETTVDSDSNVIKTLFGCTWKFVGSNILNDFFEFPCDVLMFDEYDRLNQENIPYAYDRIGDSKNKIVWKFGNPTRHGFGIHAEWLTSDAKVWKVECHCGCWQELDWYKHFVIKSDDNSWKLRNEHGYPICLKCSKPFDRLGEGKWVKTNPDCKISGYKISRLFVLKEQDDIQQLFARFVKAQFNQSALQNFHNNYLSEPYENADFKITAELFTTSVKRRPTLPKEQPKCVMGVDQGRHFTCYISTVLDGAPVDILYKNVSSWEEVEALETAYNVICTVIDAQGGGYAETRNFVKNSKQAQRFMCYYRPKDRVKTQFNINYDDRVVECNRTEMADIMVKVLITMTMVRPDWESIDEGNFAKQMMFPARMVNPDTDKPVWTKGNDHYFHAGIYRQMALLISGLHNGYSIEKKRWHVDSSYEENKYERLIAGIPAVIGGEAEKTPEKKSWRRGSNDLD